MADVEATASGMITAVQAWLGPAGTLVAIIGSCIGTVYLPVRMFMLSRVKTDTDAAKAFRDELREEVKALRIELREAREEIDELREKYQRLFNDYLDEKHYANNLAFQVKGAGAVPVQRKPGGAPK